MRDLRFWKLCGSGTGEGFTPIPNTAVWAILTIWPSEATARYRTGNEPLFQRWRARADESWSVYLSAIAVRGAWSGQRPFEVANEPGQPGALAALTRATVRTRALTRFWGRVPAIEDMIGSDPNVVFKIGIGEIPWLHQVTFSIWPDAQAMNAFARTNGPHAEAIRAVRDGAWFREELYARFRVLGDAGSWGGSSPLDRLERIAA